MKKSKYPSQRKKDLAKAGVSNLIGGVISESIELNEERLRHKRNLISPTTNEDNYYLTEQDKVNIEFAYGRRKK